MAETLRSADVVAGFHADVARLRSEWLEPWRALANHDVLSVRPAPKKWSAIDCLEHTRRVNHPYTRWLGEAVERATARSRRPVEAFRPSLVGARMVRTLRPRAQPAADGRPRLSMPMPTFGSFDPVRTSPPPDVATTLDGFDAQLEAFAGLAKAIEGIDLHVRCRTLFPLLKLRVGDAVRFLVAHADRHHVQAERAIAAAGGPG